MARKQGASREGGKGNLSLAERVFQQVSVPPGSSRWRVDAETVVRSWKRRHHTYPPRTRQRRRLHGLFWVGLIVGCVLVWIGVRLTHIPDPECSEFQIASQLSGTSDRLTHAVGKCEANLSGWDLVKGDFFLLAGYSLVGCLILIAGWWRYEAQALRRLSWIIWLPGLAAVCDLVENLVLWAVLKPGPGHPEFDYSDWRWWWVFETLLLTASWLKWMCLAVAAVAILMALSVWIVRRAELYPLQPIPPKASATPTPSPDVPPTPSPDLPPAPTGEDRVVGVCVSGGGIRAAAFALGVLGQLEPGGSAASSRRNEEGMHELRATVGAAAGLTPATTPPPADDRADAPAITDPGQHADRRRELDRPCAADDPELAPSARLTVETTPGAWNLDREGPATTVFDPWGPLGEARYLAAVSGGAWAATAWTLQEASRNTRATKSSASRKNSADAVITGLVGQSCWSPYQRQKYLLNSRHGLLPTLGWVLFCTATNVVYVYSLLFLIAWPLGWFIARPVISCKETPGCFHGAAIPDALLPGVGLAVVACFVLLVCGTCPRLSTKWPIGAALFALSLLSAVFLVALPALFHVLENWEDAWEPLWSTISASVVVSVGGILWKLFGGPLLHQVEGRLARLLPRLLGVLLALLFLFWLLTVMYISSRGWWSNQWVLMPMALLLVISLALSPNWPTLHNVFSKRLRTTFDPTAHACGGKPDLAAAWRWGDLEGHTRGANHVGHSTERVPELLLCCAQQRNGIALGGLRAETFTISPRWVRQGGRTMPTQDYLTVAAGIQRTLGKGGYEDLDCVSSWLATTGAAFSSAMGRSSLGSTNAFLATINADLGIWLPNVIALQEGGHHADRAAADVDAGRPNWWRRLRHRLAGSTLPRPRMGYMLKEILGWYGKHDRYVFVTDGGHWDNLGLVELLRRNCNVIYCVDASGDPIGTFATLREALSLASLELDGFAADDMDVEDALAQLKPIHDGAALTNITTLRIRRQLGGAPITVEIHYVKLQACQAMSKELRRYAIADPGFPHYSTANQFLTPQQFDNLVELGRDSGRRLRASSRTWLRTGNVDFPLAMRHADGWWVLRQNGDCPHHGRFSLFVDGQPHTRGIPEPGFVTVSVPDDGELDDQLLPQMDRDDVESVVAPLSRFAVYGSETGVTCEDCRSRRVTVRP
jgi:hypothetical protein